MFGPLKPPSENPFHLLSIEAYGSATEEDGDLRRRIGVREAMQGPEAPEVLQGAIHRLGDLHLDLESQVAGKDWLKGDTDVECGCV